MTEPALLRWGSGATPLERLVSQPSSFDFYQAVRILAHSSQGLEEQGKLAGRTRREPVASSLPIRFRSQMNSSFAGSDIAGLIPGDNDHLPELLVNFLGLAGAQGPLPSVYTEPLLSGNPGPLREFLDIFNHRLILLVYRIHATHFPELTPSDPADSLAANHLYAICGLGRDPDSKARTRSEFHARELLQYCGLLAYKPRSAAGLERMLSDFFEIPVTVDQFAGAWLDFGDGLRTTIGWSGRNRSLGVSAVVGSRIWDEHAGISLRLGPLDLGTFQSFLPNGSRHGLLNDLARFYLGPEFDVSLNLILDRDQIPPGALAGPAPAGGKTEPALLGWLAWLGSAPAGKEVPSNPASTRPSGPGES